LNVADHAADNPGHLLDNDGSSILQVISEMRIDDYVLDNFPKPSYKVSTNRLLNNQRALPVAS